MARVIPNMPIKHNYNGVCHTRFMHPFRTKWNLNQTRSTNSIQCRTVSKRERVELDPNSIRLEVLHLIHCLLYFQIALCIWNALVHIRPTYLPLCVHLAVIAERDRKQQDPSTNCQYGSIRFSIAQQLLFNRVKVDCIRRINYLFRLKTDRARRRSRHCYRQVAIERIWRNLKQSARIWRNLKESARIGRNVHESARIWKNLQECEEIWKNLKEPQIFKRQFKLG